jgi:hypothetical protein
MIITGVQRNAKFASPTCDHLSAGMQHRCQCLDADASDRLLSDHRIVQRRESCCAMVVVHPRLLDERECLVLSAPANHLLVGADSQQGRAADAPLICVKDC